MWVIDDGEKVGREATATPYERGEQNPVWHPGKPVRLFALRDEVVAFQVVVEADAAALPSVTVDVRPLSSNGGARLPSPSRFVESFVRVRRASGGRTAGESLGWEAGSGPPPGAWIGWVPDALVPVERAPSWAAYPMRIAPNTNGVLWVDVYVPRDQAPGLYQGTIDVANEGRALSSIRLELDVKSVVLPPPTGEATVFYDPEELERRMGDGAEEALWKLLHAHRVSPLHDATSPADVGRQRDALSGALYASERGYVGPGANRGDGVLAIGAYGALGAPDFAKTSRVQAIVDAAARARVLAGTDVFVYADDEQCDSPLGAAWREALRSSPDARVRAVRVAWTCTEDPAKQPVDIAMLLAHYDVAQADRSRRLGKEVWVYNGVLPRTGTFLLDADAISPRVNGWLAAMYGVRRWFYWEATYWYGQHGAAPIDPFVEPETLHNRDGDWANGDGVLVYPARQDDAFGEHSLGYTGVLPSIRLKNWRRGLQDGAYLELARARDRARADAVARSLVPIAFDDAKAGRPPSWSPHGAAFAEARRALLAIAVGEPASPGGPGAPPTSHSPSHARLGWGAGGAAALLALGAVLRAYLARPLRLGMTRIPRPSSQARRSIPQRAAE